MKITAAGRTEPRQNPLSVRRRVGCFDHQRQSQTPQRLPLQRSLCRLARLQSPLNVQGSGDGQASVPAKSAGEMAGGRGTASQDCFGRSLGRRSSAQETIRRQTHPRASASKAHVLRTCPLRRLREFIHRQEPRSALLARLTGRKAPAITIAQSGSRNWSGGFCKESNGAR